MRLSADEARERFASARVARLASVTPAGRPHLVPIVFALVGDVVYSAVDAKPKSTTSLRRLANIATNPHVTVLTDHYSDDWAQLWWARADGHATVMEMTQRVLELLAGRYPQYAVDPPPGPVIRMDVDRWSGWAAGR